MPGRERRSRRGQIYKRKMAELAKGVKPKEEKKEKVSKEEKPKEKVKKETKAEKVKKIFKKK